MIKSEKNTVDTENPENTIVAEKPYKTGYCRPPVANQFKPGSSGNPKGRPKGARGLKTDLKAELSKKVAVMEGGKKHMMRKQEVIVNQLTSKAAKGDLKAIAKVIDVIRDAFGLEDEEIRGAARLSVSDEQLLEDFKKDIASRIGENNDHS